MNNAPLSLMIHRTDLYGFTYLTESGSKQKTPLLKKAGIRCMVQDTPPELITWYWQRQEKVNNSMFLIDRQDFERIAINDRIVYEGNNYRVAGRVNQAGLKRVYRVDLALEE